MHRDMDALKAAVEALKCLMEEWARWSQGYRMKLGYPTRAAGMSGTGMSSFDEMCDSVDQQTMKSVDAVVQEDLTPIERAAVLRCYGVASVFRFPRENYGDVLMQAHERLLVLLQRKGVIV